MSALNCEWIEDRWHLVGRPIHAGVAMELRASSVGHFDAEGIYHDDGPGPWHQVRIESHDRGRILLAFVEFCGCTYNATVGQGHELRWIVGPGPGWDG